jgi:hypothetical protein
MDQLKLLSPEQIRALSVEQLTVIMNNGGKDKVPELKSLFLGLRYDYRLPNNDGDQDDGDPYIDYDVERKENQQTISKILKQLNKCANQDFYIISANGKGFKCFTKEEIFEIIPEEIIDKFLFSKDIREKYKFLVIENYEYISKCKIYYDLITKVNNLHIISFTLLQTYSYFQIDCGISDFIKKL